MLGHDPALNFEESVSKRSPKRVLVFLVLLAACSLLWTGCNTFNQNAEAANPNASAASSLPLPNATVGSSYRTLLSANGARWPYSFVISQGELPPGLALNTTSGDLSGTPTHAGDFTFTISVKTHSVSGLTRPYTLNVSPCAACVNVRISPVDPSVAAGGKVQFSALVSNTSNTAVSWSTSAGTISNNGLFASPSNTGAKPITVTATLAGESSIKASTSVTVESATAQSQTEPRITTSSVPPTIENSPYSAALSVAGGQPPYQWSIASGSLPAGLQLTASNGTLSGAAIHFGTFNFSVQVTDAALNTARQNLSVVVSTQGSCGPPAYDCSRSDLKIVQMPKTPPSVGNLAGANTIVSDPDFGNRIVRITDANTNPEATFKNRTFTATASGSADANLWNTDSTLFIVQDTGTYGYPFTFNPTTMQAARMYVSSFPASNGITLPYGGDWSRVNPNVLYTFGKTTIAKYDFTDRTTPPSPQQIYDFTSNPNCLPAGFKPAWGDSAGISGDDTVFGTAYSNTGGQGTGIYVMVYKMGSGCSTLNTQTGQVGGDWGSKGTINIADRWTIHGVKLSKDGNWMVIVPTNCTSSSCSAGPYFWQVGTTNVTSCGQGGACSGHWTEGYSHWVNNDNSPMSNQVFRSFAQATSVSNLTTSFPPGITAPFDQHQSWNNVDAADTLPFFSTTWSTTSPFTAPWYNEIIAVAADGSGKTWRFAHTFITAQSQRFSTKYAIGTISQDGRFFILSSDWLGKLGSESGTPTCTIGSNCRGDVFVVELR